MGAKDAWGLGYPINACYIHWAAQSGKTITLQFFLNSDFRSGSQISQNSGGVSIVEGTSSSFASTTLSAATAAALGLGALSTRNVATYYNDTGAVLFVGSDATVTNAGATKGIPVQPGDSIVWKNTAALYGYSVAGGVVEYLEEV